MAGSHTVSHDAASGRQCIDLKERFGAKYRIELDPAAAHEPGGRTDPWYFQIPCRHGHIYPHSATHLALWWESSARLDLKCPALMLYQDGDLEKVYLFLPEHFDEVARVVGPKRRRQATPAQRKALLDHGRHSRFQKHGDKGSFFAPGREISAKSCPDMKG